MGWVLAVINEPRLPNFGGAVALGTMAFWPAQVWLASARSAINLIQSKHLAMPERVIIDPMAEDSEALIEKCQELSIPYEIYRKSNPNHREIARSAQERFGRLIEVS